MMLPRPNPKPLGEWKALIASTVLITEMMTAAKKK
jgi:hypothetical protein